MHTASPPSAKPHQPLPLQIFCCSSFGHSLSHVSPTKPASQMQVHLTGLVFDAAHKPWSLHFLGHFAAGQVMSHSGHITPSGFSGFQAGTGTPVGGRVGGRVVGVGAPVVGTIVGSLVLRAVGLAVGGAVVGVPVAPFGSGAYVVGSNVGSYVDLVVGLSVGCVGAFVVGASVGTCVGLRVGLGVGARVGVLVEGAWVGLRVGW